MKGIYYLGLICVGICCYLSWPFVKLMVGKIFHILPRPHRPQLGLEKTIDIRNKAFPCFKGKAEVRTCAVCGTRDSRNIRYRFP